MFEGVHIGRAINVEVFFYHIPYILLTPLPVFTLACSSPRKEPCKIRGYFI
jgi:hypothetical protein